MNNLLKLVLLICGSWLFAFNVDWRFSYLLPFILILFVPHKKLLVDLTLGFISIFLVWLTAALIIDGGNNSILSTRLAKIFGLANGPTLVVFSGILGGFIGGLGAVTGHFLHNSLQKTNDND
ncbi:hypothetical protein KUV50_16475 [Membranicola marinus]|uniref:Uncharacterized protein n=1 Tax=Membranihabitans marinus TaxID=1227546 RepID=A0A953HX34_9BACT|nr:hypothetical protein [Membranihabitans marinus]MBY5959751.1 hypothetical protein [Membranihabitans marinus]